MELVVVRINWEHILAFAPIINGGNIYWTKSEHFWDTFLQFYTTIFYAEEGPDPFSHFAEQYCELRAETTRIEQPTIAALQCIKNQLPTRSGSVYKSKSL